MFVLKSKAKNHSLFEVFTSNLFCFYLILEKMYQDILKEIKPKRDKALRKLIICLHIFIFKDFSKA